MKVFAAALAVAGLVAASSLGAVDVTLKAKVGTTTYTGTVPASAYTPGVPVTLQVYVQDTVSGVLGLAGDVVPSGASSLSTPASGAAWLVKYKWIELRDENGNPSGKKVAVVDTNESFIGSPPQPQIIYGDYTTTGDEFTGYTIPSPGTGPANPPSPPIIIPPMPPYEPIGCNIGGIPQPNGGMGGLGSGQALSAAPNSFFARSEPVMVCSYTFNWNSSVAPTTLSWIDSGIPGAMSHGGWFTCGTALNDNGVGTVSNITFLPEPITLSLFALGGLLVARRPVRNQ